MKVLADLLLTIFKEGNRWVRTTIVLVVVSVLATVIYMSTKQRLDAGEKRADFIEKRLDQTEVKFE